MTKLKHTLSMLFLLWSMALLAQTSQNMTLLASWDDPTIPTNSFGWQYADCWAWSNASGEYAIIGSTRFVHIFKINYGTTVTLTEVYRFDGGTNTAWREFRTYGNYLYAVTDQTSEGLKIFDLSNLPTSVTKVYDSTTFFSKCHTIHVDAATGRLYCAGTNTRNNGLIVLDIATNPAAPTLLASVALPPGNYVHDCYVRNNIVYCSHGNYGLIGWNFTTPTAPTVVGSMTTYVEKGYNHSTWMNDAGTHLVQCDETNNTGVKTVNITDPTYVVVDTFRSTLLAPTAVNSIAHNPCVVGNFVYISYYGDGISVWDISNPADVQRVGYYDTEPNNTNYTANATFGAWGVCPYLPSGNIVASDVNRGLMIIDLNTDCRAPTTFNSTALTTYSVNLDWNDVPGATQYRLRYRPSTSATWTVVTTTTSARNLTALDANTTYIMQVGSNCAYGWTNYAKQYSITTKAVGTCATPSDAWVTNLQATTATINWNPSSGVTNYRLLYRKVGVATWTVASVNGATFKNLTGLAPNKTYEYKVASKCTSTQFSAFTPVKTFTTPPTIEAPQAADRDEVTLAETSKAIALYPNPASTELHIELTDGQAIAGLRVQILDASGKIVMDDQFDEESHFIYDLGQLPAGLYVCSVQAGDKTWVERFVKN